MTTKLTTRVAILGTLSDTDNEWIVFDCPVDALGSYDAEGSEIYDHLPERFTGIDSALIVVDTIEGFDAGCSTWAGLSRAEDDEFPEGSEYAQARAEHRDCEHDRFGKN